MEQSDFLQTPHNESKSEASCSITTKQSLVAASKDCSNALAGGYMSSFSFEQISIKAVAAAVPAHVHTFDQSSRRAKRFSQQMGIDEVHISLTEQTSLDLGYVALANSLEYVGWPAQELDLVIFNTQSPDFRGGVGDSILLHKYLNLREDCAVFDLPVGCAALPYLMAIAGSMMSCAHDINKVAILAGDTKWMQYESSEEISTKAIHLSGEGTGVMLLERNSVGTPSLNVEIFAQGKGYLNLFNLPSLKNAWHRSEEYILPDGARWHVGSSDSKNYMNGMAIHEFVTQEVCSRLKERWGTKLPNYDFFAFHQANQQILNLLCTNLGIAPERMLSSLKHYGNTSTASVLITLCDNDTKLKEGGHVFSASYGMGFTWGFIDLVLPPNVVLPIVSTEHSFTEHMLQPVPAES